MAEPATAEVEIPDDQDLIVDLNKVETTPAEGAEKSAKPPPVPGPGSNGAAPSKSSTEPQTGMADLQRQMQAERQQRERVAEENRRLQTERDQAIAFAQEAERRGMSTYELYNENQIKATADAMDALTSQQETAYSEGDFKRVADINKRLNRLGGQLAILERDQAALVQQRETMAQQARQPQPQRQPQQPRQPVPADPLERAIMNRSEPTKAFLRKHPDLIRGDGSLKRSAIDAHERALDANLVVDTPEYFDYIEKNLGPGMQPTTQSTQHRQQQVAPAQSYAAPVARGGPPQPGQLVDGQFRMTANQRRLAAEQGVSNEEWASNYVKLLRAGKITPIP